MSVVPVCVKTFIREGHGNRLPPGNTPVRVSLAQFDSNGRCQRCDPFYCGCEWCETCDQSVNPWKHFTVSHRDTSLPGMPYSA